MSRTGTGSKSKPKPKPQAQPPPPPPPPKKNKTKQKEEEPPPDFYAIRDIIGEKIENGCTRYLIDWDGTDERGNRYAPSWEPAEHVTAFAINEWKNKQNNKASRLAHATGQVKVPFPFPFAGGPEQAVEEREQKKNPTNRTLVHTEEGAGNQREAIGSSTPSHPLPTDSSDTGIIETRPVKEIQGAQIVVELPTAPNFNPSEFIAIQFSQASQTSSQATLPERFKSKVAANDQRVIPDSQEISGTSISQENSSYHELNDFLVESQHSADEPNLLGQSGNLQTSTTSGIPSHQPESQSRFAGVSGFFANPTISANCGLNANPVFETQLGPDVNAVDLTPATASCNTIPASLSQNPGTHTSQGTESQSSQTTNRGSASSNSQEAQIVQPLVSHPDHATSHSHLDFSVFAKNRPVPEIIPRDSGTQEHSQSSSQALSVIDGNSRISTVEEHYGPVTSTVPPEEQSPAGNGDEPILCHASVGLPRETRPAISAEMEHMSAADRLRAYRETHFKSSFTESTPPVSTSPTVSSPLPLDSAPHVAHNPTPQAEVEVEVETGTTSALDVHPPSISPALLLQSGPTQTQSEPPFGSTLPPISSDPPANHTSVDPIPLGPYDTAQMAQPITLDPSALTLSIENDVNGSPSVPTEDDFATGPLPGSTHSDEDETQEDLPRSLLPHVPTGPSEYLVTLPFQTGTRPQYNDIIRENEALMQQYNSAFRVLPHQTPHKSLIEKLDAMFARLLDICDFPHFRDDLEQLSTNEIAKHVIGTNAKFAFVAELLDNLQSLNSDKNVLILVRPGQLMDLLGYVIQSRGCHYIRSGRDVISVTEAKHPLTVSLSATSEAEYWIPTHVDAVIAFDHTFRHESLSPIDQSTPPIILTLVNTASIQHINMRILENLQPLERKNVLMLAMAKAMQSIEEPDPSESLFFIAEKFARRIQMPEDEEDEFYWEPQSVPIAIFDDLYAASSQLEALQPSRHSLGADQPGSRKRSYIDGDDESLAKRPKIYQPQLVTSLNHISDAVRGLLGDDFTPSPDNNAVVVSVDKLQALSNTFVELQLQLEQSKARANEFRELSDRNQKETNSYVSSINNIQKRYMEALKERGIFEADCRTAQEQATVLSNSLDSCRTEIATLKMRRAELEKKLAEANEALLNSSNPDLVRLGEMERDLKSANAQVEDLKKRLVVTQSDVDYNKNLYNHAFARAVELASENRTHERRIEELQRKADDNVLEVNKIQSRNEARVFAQQISEQKSIVREREAELGRVKEELKMLRSGRRETRQSSVPRSPRPSMGVMSPRNGRGPSAMGGPSSSRGTSPQPPMAVFDGHVGAGNGVQNAALFNQGVGSARFAHLRDQRF
ncbi:hypothetical protein F5Y03DRAFT_381513 [Xylaria venustula]|nr:hypothetical protein F5Y03DRAFT_381513 [Xylaria venustula]